MPRLLLTLLVLSPTALLADDASTSNADVAAGIAPFLDARTFLVAHIDVERVDTDGLFAFLSNSMPALQNSESDEPLLEQPSIKKARQRIAGARQALLAVGARHVYVLTGWDDVLVSRPVVVIPTWRPEAAGTLAKMLSPLDRRRIEYVRAAVVIGDDVSVARFRRAQPVTRPDILAALAATGDAAARIVVASPAEERRVMRTMLPERLPEPLGTRYRALLTGADWFALYGDPPPTLRARFVTSMPDGPGAEAMQSFQRDLLAALANWPAAKEEVPNIERIVALPKFTVEGNRVVLSLTDEAQVAAVVDALRPNLVTTFGGLVRDARINTMRQLGLAFHNYADTRMGTFPPRGTEPGSGLSWRVHILPYVEQKPLYDRFKLDEAWDSPHNRALLAEMPALYAARSGDPGMTTYVLPIAEGAIYDKDSPPEFRDVRDGLSNTILVVDVGDDLAVPWTKPADWEIDWEAPLKGVVQPGTKGFLATFADGAVRTLENDLVPETLKAYVTRSGDESVR